MAEITHPALCLSRVLVFAHRGGAGLGPENTIAAFDQAVALGVDGFELDVRLSQDGVAVVHHDSTLDRTTDAHGSVGDLTGAELARRDAAFHFRPEEGYPLRGRGIGVPRLSEVLARYRDVPMIIEIKGPDPGLACTVVNEVRAAGAADRVCLGGFSYRSIRAARRAAPSLPTGASRPEIRWALYRSSIGRPVSRPSYQVYHVPERARGTTVVSPRFIADAHAIGLPVQVWTVDLAADMERLLDWRIDGIITDRPDVALEVVARRRGQRR